MLMIVTQVFDWLPDFCIFAEETWFETAKRVHCVFALCFESSPGSCLFSYGSVNRVVKGYADFAFIHLIE
ncbi:hypothetical protein AB3S75_038641 [Citrus x aurantiifolia]